MNEVKKARQQLNARNGLQPASKKKAPKKRSSPKPSRTDNTSKNQPRQNVGPRPTKQKQRTGKALPQKRKSPTALEERQHAQQAVAAKRRKKRKKNYALYYIILFLFIVVAGVILSLTVFFNIEEISVEGTSRYSTEEIIEKSGLHTGDNLFRISTGDASTRIIDAFGYIDKVDIDRAFPNKLVISITEAQPVMSFESGGVYTLVSDQGRILESGLPEPKENTFIVTGVTLEGYSVGDFISVSQSPEIETLNTISDICSEIGITGLTQVDFNSVVDIRLYLHDQIRVDIGSISDLEYKLTFAREIIETRLDEGQKGVIDVKQAGTAYYRPNNDLSNSSSLDSDSSQSDPLSDTSEPSSS